MVLFAPREAVAKSGKDRQPSLRLMDGSSRGIPKEPAGVPSSFRFGDVPTQPLPLSNLHRGRIEGRAFGLRVVGAITGMPFPAVVPVCAEQRSFLSPVLGH